MKFLFIYVDDIKDAVRCRVEKSGKSLTDAELDILSKQAKLTHGPDNPIAGNPRLGILTLASVLREKFGDQIEVQQCDMGFECLEPNDLRWKLLEFQPDFVGLSAMLPFSEVFHQVSQVVKKVLPDCCLIAGGPYVTSAPKRAMDDENVDLGVLYEGEETLPELLEALAAGKDLQEVRGIGYRKEGELKFTPPRPMLLDINEIPRPAVDLIDLDKYAGAYRILSTPSKSMPLFSSRGCPYECTFCHNLSGKTVRWRSAENVFEEMEYYYKNHQVREFFFWDDIFNLNIKRANRLMDLILKSGMKFRFSFPRGMRGDILSFDLIDKMVEAGFWMSSFAVETASPRLQKKIKKHNDFEKLARVIEYSVQQGVLVTTFNMVDFPTETEEEMMMTLDFNRSLPHHDVTLFKLSPFEGTEIYNQLGGYDHHEHLGAATFYKYRKKIISQVAPEFLESFIKEFGLSFYFDKKRLASALSFQSPHVSSEKLRDHFQAIYQMALQHYGIKEEDLADGESVDLLNEILAPSREGSFSPGLSAVNSAAVL